MNVQNTQPSGAENAADSVEEQIIRMSMLSFERLPVLEGILGRFSASLSSALNAYSASTAEASVQEITYKSYSESLGDLPSGGFMAVTNVSPGDKSMLTVLEPELLMSAIEVMLGGRTSKQKAWTPREYTAIEKTLGTRLCEVVLAKLGESFSDLHEMRFSISHLENSMKSVALLAPGTGPSVHVTLDMKFEGRGGLLTFVIPYTAIEKVQPMLAQAFWGGGLGADNSWRTLLTDKIQETNVTLTSVLHELSVPMTQVLAWAPGTTLDLGIDTHHEAELSCSGVPMFKAAMGRRKNGSVALRITEEMTEKDGLSDDGTSD